MIFRSSSRLPAQCFYKDCQSQLEGVSNRVRGPKSGLIVRRGYFLRSSDSRRISRFQCLSCRRTFSRASYSDCFRQKKRKLNEPIRKLIRGGSSNREAARNLGVSRHTVDKKALFLGIRAESWQGRFLKSIH